MPPKPIPTSTHAALDPIHLAELERIDRRLRLVLYELGNYLHGQKLMARDKGVLGSRGITQFIAELLRAKARESFAPGAAPLGLNLADILAAAERAGYVIPTPGTLSAKLNQRAYRVGDVRWRKTEVTRKRGAGVGVWYWCGTAMDRGELI